MDPMVVVMAIGLSLVTGLVIGITAIVAMAVRREDRLYSLTRQAPGVAARGVRRLTGVGLRDVTPIVVRVQTARRVTR